MKITKHLTDDLILRELGERLAHARLQLDLTQAALAEQAGVSKRARGTTTPPAKPGSWTWGDEG